MKLTIIIPVYNVEKYIIECLNSIYDKKHLTNFEVICVDDCGKDNSIDVICKYVKEKNIKNLSVVKHDKNKGLSASRNTGLRYAKGKYICFLDSDDMIDSKNLEELVNYAVEKKLDVLEANFTEIFETEMSISVNSKRIDYNSDILSGDAYFTLMCENNNYVPMVWTRIYSFNYLIENNLKFVLGLKFEDEEFTPRALISADRVQYVNKFMYVYRRRDNSITTNMVKNNDWVNHYMIIINNLLDFNKNNSNIESYNSLNNRISELILSLYKNPLAYKANKKYFKEIVNLVKKNKLYNIPMSSNKKSLKMQGKLMKYPKIFIIIYKIVGGFREKA